MNKKKPHIILASNSPRRKQLLEQIDLSFDIIPSKIYEDFSIDLDPKAFAQHYAKAKACDLAKNYPNALVIGADTIVVFDGQILGKPKDEEDSVRMLSMLSGQTHAVITGVSLQWENEQISETFCESTKVTFRPLSKSDILHYIKIYQPFDKAGSYGIQDWFSVCVEKINGDFYNVMGFPLSAFYQKFRGIID
ncbi:MAG: septum formation protein Maf [Candidatus Marinimicrobia bacterium]|nr:septum formation protein Maf [Candidatus Neomarinimicrobiota bacterium]MBT3732920.1 septum formation protein Maf [Candidatus Neomarinimicrobiota bacterium]MBT6736900.1 septum formation protein Maf [Candidatus Neomarinimicrobiota bacterium]MBT7184277.1 septum formation protein Maf [Candidatus Neomarinimicrobiota bacterium]